MYVIAANLTAIPSQRDKLLQLVSTLAQGSLTEEACKRFEIYQSVEDANELIMYEEWLDLDDTVMLPHKAAGYYRQFDELRDAVVAKSSINKYRVCE